MRLLFGKCLDIDFGQVGIYQINWYILNKGGTMARKIWSLCLALFLVGMLLTACRAPEDTPTLVEPVEELRLLFVHNATSGTLTPLVGTEDTFILTLEGVVT